MTAQAGDAAFVTDRRRGFVRDGALDVVATEGSRSRRDWREKVIAKFVGW